MATTKQKTAARRNIKKAQKARGKSSGRAEKKGSGLSTSKKDRMQKATFAFPDERKEPLSDAAHVRNAIARFDQVEGVSDTERDKAWKRIRKAAKSFDVEVSADNWRDLFKGGKARKRNKGKSKSKNAGKKGKSKNHK